MIIILKTVTAAAAAADADAGGDSDSDTYIVYTGHSVNNWAAEVTRHFERRQEPADGSSS